MYFRTNVDTSRLQGAMDWESRVALGECPKSKSGCEYPGLSIPASLQGSSGEPGQIMLDGPAKKITLYHGWFADWSIRDRELDWHVYIDVSSSTKQSLLSQLLGTGCNLTPDRLREVYCELMVLDHPKLTHALIESETGWTREGELGYRSADVSIPFRLEGSKHPAWDLSRIAAANQHHGQDFSKYSRLYKDQGYVYLQGPFVNDAYHDLRLEIHPLDSIAFAIDKQGKTIPMRQGEPGWPADEVQWRVGAFTNSTLHRVNKCPFLQKERTTTWYLTLPTDAYRSGVKKRISVIPIHHRLWNGIKRAWYESRGVSSISSALEKDPKDGLLKLKVSVTMKAPDAFGGMFVRDFLIRTS